MKELRKLNRLMNEELGGEEYQEYVPTRRRRSGVPKQELASFFDRKYRQAMSDMMQARQSYQIHSSDFPLEKSKFIPKELLDYLGHHPNEWRHIGNKRYNESTLLKFNIEFKDRPDLDPVLFQNGQYGFDIFIEFSLFDLEKVLIICYQRGNSYFDENEPMEVVPIFIEMGLEGFDRSHRFIGTLEDMVDEYVS